MGAKAGDGGSLHDQWQALVDGVNARGGIANRKVVPVFHDFNTAELLHDPNPGYQAACEHWTVDRPVFAVFNGFALMKGDETLISCLAKRRTLIVPWNPGITRPESVFARHAPYLYAPNQASVERVVPVLIQRLVARGYFSGWNSVRGQRDKSEAKIGVLTVRGYGAAFARTVRKELARRSRTVSAEYEVSGNFDTVQSEMQQAVLRFRDAGVTHVIAQGTEVVFFGTAAASQNYRPRYGLTSSNKPMDLEANLPREQLMGAVGFGYIPTRDVGTDQDPGDVSPAQARCRAIMERAGQPTSSRNAMGYMTASCDAFNFFVAAVNGGGVSPESYKRGVQSLKTIRPSSTFRMLFPGGRPHGAAAGRDLAYFGDCGCFKYTDRQNHAM